MRIIIPILIVVLVACATYVNAQACDSTVPIVDAFDYPRSNSSNFYRDLAQGDKLAELFYTADNGDTARLALVSLLVEPIPGSDTFGEGRAELWTDDGAAFPNNLPGVLIDVLGNFSTPRSADSPVELNVENLEIDLQPNTGYWLLVTSTSGTVRWVFTDYAFQQGCPTTTEEGRFGQQYTFARNGTEFNETRLDYGFISVFSVERCNSSASASPTPTATPTPTGTPSIFPTPFPIPTGRPRRYIRS